MDTVGKYFAELPDIDVLVGCGKNVFAGKNLAQPQKAVNFWLTLAVNFWLTLVERFLGFQVRPIIQDTQDQRTYIKALTLKDIKFIFVNNPIPQIYNRKTLTPICLFYLYIWVSSFFDLRCISLTLYGFEACFRRKNV